MIRNLSLPVLLLGAIHLGGCASANAGDEAEDTSAAATAHAPEDVEASALEGTTLTIDTRIDVAANSGGTRLGDTTFALPHANLDIVVCQVAMEALSPAKRWIDPAAYVIAKVETFANMGVDLFLQERDGQPSDFRVRCYAYTRVPLAKEMQRALEAKITLDQKVLAGSALSPSTPPPAAPEEGNR
jgi:hypothetical protein